MASFACDDKAEVLCSFEQDGIAWVTLNRPDKGNALNPGMIHLLTDIFEAINQKDDIRMVVLQAQGKHFCLGADLEHMRRQKDVSHAANVRDAEQLARMMDTLNQTPKPIVAVVQGKVYGGGVGILACADIVLADEAVECCLSEIKLGLFPAVISPYVINAIGLRHAKRYMLTGEVFSASTALQLGLFHTLFHGKTRQTVIEATIKQLRQAAPKASMALKQWLTAFAWQRDASERAQAIANIRITEEAQEGLASFLEKRKPAWSEE